MTLIDMAAVVLSSTLVAGLASGSDSIDFDSKAEQDSIDVVATDGQSGGGQGARNGDGSLPSVERRAALGANCAVGDTIVASSLVDPCEDGQLSSSVGFECDPGDIRREPVAERTWTNNPDGSVSNLSQWTLISTWECTTPAEIAAAAEAEFARLTITPSPVTIQPPDGWTLVNVDTITYTSRTPQTFTTTLLGIPVTIEATPVAFTWDYDDGTAPVTTADPGQAYPRHTVAHVYTQEATATITLATTWHGRFQITGTTTWTPITGTATTTTTAPPLTIHEARSRLVTDPLG